MKKVTGGAQAQVNFTVTFELTDYEAKALSAIASYSTDEFIKVFYENLGKSALQPYEADLRNLFKTIRDKLPTEIAKIDKAKIAISQALTEFK